MQLSPLMANEIQLLNSAQRRAATADGDVVIRAGPGSGKTRTLVARAGYMLETEISPFRGVACITYTNAAAREVRQRLRQLGVRTERRLTCSTMHAFCLNDILRAFSGVTGEWIPSAGEVLDEGAVTALHQQCFDELRIGDLHARYQGPTLTRIRRALACGEPVEAFDQREVRAAQMLERRLVDSQRVDFEAMVIRALRVVRDHRAVGDLLRARYPHVVVDEYQDLGGVLHQLVLALHEAGLIVSAVGDADQSIFGFTGADPRYLEELARRPDFTPIELEVNYRSGPAIVAASEAALGRTGRNRRSAEGLVTGVVTVTAISGPLDAHAAEVVSLVEAKLESGVPHERVAVLYPRRGAVLDALLSAFHEATFPFLFEKDETLPGGSLSRFVQECASRAAVVAQVHQHGSGGSALKRSESPDLLELAGALRRLRTEAGLPSPIGRLTLLRSLQAALDPPTHLTVEDPALPWVVGLKESLGLSELAAAHPDVQNNRALTGIERACESRALAIQDLAASIEVLGKVVLTNFHTAKGREWHTVILPGLVNGLVPADVPIGSGRWGPPTGAELEEQRRLFFVALSRAQAEVNCLVGSGYPKPWGDWVETGPSDFVVEMERRRRTVGT